MHKSRFLLLLLVLPLVMLAFSQDVKAQGSSVLYVSLDNDIGLAEEVMFDDVIAVAQNLDADLILVELNTPGGTVESVKNIMTKFDNSPIPICILIPLGAVAWSGGTYLLMASDIAAMASGATIGSCQPVGNNGVPITDSKYLNALIGLMVNHAELHNRNETLAEQFITLNTNLGPAAALSKKVIEFVADSPAYLLTQLNEYMLVRNETGSVNYTTIVPTFSGSYTYDEVLANFTALNIGSAELTTYSTSISTYFIRFITNPTVVSVFLTVGAFGLIIGLTTTNTHLDEIVGAIALIIGLIGVGIIGIDVGAIILFVIGLAFFLAEIKFDVGFNGSLAIGGGICIALASLFIIPSSNYLTIPDFLISAKWIAFGISVGFIAFFSVIAIKVLQTKRMKSDLEVSSIVGQRGYVKKDLTPEGQVHVKAEEWSAIAVEGTWPILQGEEIEVVKVDGLRLVVKPIRD
jgi:membrane-bound serine protease (ClpP class)